MTEARDKQAIRSDILQRRQDLTSAAVDAASAEIVRHLATLPPLLEAKSVGLYAPILNEVDPLALRDQLLLRGVAVLYPRVAPVDGFPHLEYAPVNTAEDLLPGYRGIPEPRGPAVPPETLDALIVPGVAFDASGARLGYGGGSYDDWIQRIRPAAVVIGLAYPFQVMGSIPTEEHDQRVHAVATPSGVHRCTPG